jgi:hypothetical protein
MTTPHIAEPVVFLMATPKPVASRNTSQIEIDVARQGEQRFRGGRLVEEGAQVGGEGRAWIDLPVALQEHRQPDQRDGHDPRDQRGPGAHGHRDLVGEVGAVEEPVDHPQDGRHQEEADRDEHERPRPEHALDEGQRLRGRRRVAGLLRLRGHERHDVELRRPHRGERELQDDVERQRQPRRRPPQGPDERLAACDQQVAQRRHEGRSRRFRRHVRAHACPLFSGSKGEPKSAIRNAVLRWDRGGPPSRRATDRR